MRISTSTKIFYIFLSLSLMAALIGVQPVYAATLTVNTLTDENDGSCVDGDCSLRDAIQVAIDNDTINFSVTGTILLNSVLTVDKNLTITGPGSSQLTLDGNDQHRIFNLVDDNPTNTINISGMTMTKGYANPTLVCGGGAINSYAFLTMNDVVITDNHAPSDVSSCIYPRGGGILFFNNKGSLTLTNSTVSNNSTYYGGGGIYFSSSNGNISLDNVTIDGNQSTGADGGGMSIYRSLATVSITNSTITNNTASGSGAEGGGLMLYKNSTTPVVTIENTNISTNSAPDGGGIFIFSLPVSILNSTIANNSASNDGGGLYIYNGTVTINSSTLQGNTANGNSNSEGGGIYNLGTLTASSTISVINSTLTGNTGRKGGAIFNHASGGTANDIASIDIYNSTIVSNSASNSFGGAGILASSAGGTEVSTISLFNSIVYANTLTSGSSGENCATINSGTIVANNHNLFQNLPNDYCGPGVNDVTSSLPRASVVLGLTSNGGATQTMSLPTGSPALNAGNNSTCAAAPVINTSQNSVPRPQGTHCDIGSFEALTVGTILYAKPAATGSGSCFSWTDACTLSNALDIAVNGSEIWVMSGTHTPGTQRTDSFNLKSGVAIYGGFAGTETQLSQRNPATNVTILSGDLNGNDSGASNKTDNSYHVVYSDGVDNTAFLDGFVISNGYATDGNPITSVNEDNGGGLFNVNNGNPILRNIIFENNIAEYGGAVASFTGNPNITNSTFANNSAIDGGGMVLLNSDPELTNVTFNLNTASERGGAMHVQSSSDPTLMNVTIAENSATVQGGGISVDDSSNIVLTNVILWGNTAPTGSQVHVIDPPNSTATITYSVVEGGFTGTGNLSTDPLLGTLGNNGGFTTTMTLPANSPAINAGTNTGCPATDQRGESRPKGGICDIGSVEIPLLPTSATFGDVPMNHPYWEDIEILYANGFTAGCSTSPLLFCPEATMNRGESAVFMLRGNFGSSYSPPNPPYSPIFVDNWASGPWAQKWAQGMLAEGLTAGCSTSPLLYCPWEQMPRLQAAVFGMRLKEGNAYNPPAATGTVFADITDPNLWYAKWAEAAYNSGILPSCGTQGGKPLFCPNQLVSRGLGAYMIVRAKNLSMP